LRKRKILCCLLNCLFLLLTRCDFTGKTGDRTRGSTNNTDAIENFQNFRIDKPKSSSAEKQSDSLAIITSGNQIADPAQHLLDECGSNPIIQGELAIQGEWRADFSKAMIDGAPLVKLLIKDFPKDYESALKLRVPVRHQVRFCSSQNGPNNLSGIISKGDALFPLKGTISNNGNHIEINSIFSGLTTNDLPQVLQEFRFGDGEAFPPDSSFQEEISLSLALIETKRAPDSKSFMLEVISALPVYNSSAYGLSKSSILAQLTKKKPKRRTRLLFMEFQDPIFGFMNFMVFCPLG